MKKIIFLSLIIVTISCGEKEIVFTLPEDELIKLLYDIQVAEAALQTVHSSVKDSVVNIYYDQIYEQHSIDQQILLDNIAVLKKYPDQAHEIYKKVLEYHKAEDKKKK